MSLLLSILLILASTKAPPYFTERIEARVGTQIITSTDISVAINGLSQKSKEPKSKKTLRKKALEGLIEQALVKEYLALLQVDVSDQDVERRINSIRTRQGASNIEEFRSMLEMQGLSFDAFRLQVKEQMQLSQFNQVLQRQVLQTTDEKELITYYTNNKNLFEHNYEFSLQECFIPAPDGVEKIKALANKFKNGSSAFGTCVSKHSQSPSAQNKGMLGSIQSGVMRKEVESAVFGTKVGKVAMIEVPRGIQLLKVLSKKDLGARGFEDVRNEIKQAIEFERLQAAREKLLSELRSTTFIKIDS